MAHGALSETLRWTTPAVPRYLVVAELDPADPELATVWSRRKVGFPNLGAAVPDPPYLP